MDYFEAYKARIQRNEEYLFEFAKELIKNGFTVLVRESNSDPYLSGFLVIKGNKHVSVNFSEVPYRWKLSINWKPSPKTGSGKTVLEKYDLSKVDFTIEEIENNLFENYQPIEKMFSWTKLISIEQHPRFNN